MGVIETKRGRIGVSTRGLGSDGDGLPILFLHGVGSDRTVWHPQLDRFGATRGAIAADYPGYGESDPVPDATRTDYAEAMIALLDALQIGRAHVCGLSLGGIVAMLMALDHPDRIASLVLADTFAVHPDGRTIHDGSLAALDEMGMAGLVNSRVDRLLGDEPPEGLRDEVIATMARIDPDAYRLGARAVWLADLSERVAAIDCPTLVLCGSADVVTPPALSDALEAAIPRARRADIAQAGHLPNAERSTAFNRIVEDFIAGLGD